MLGLLPDTENVAAIKPGAGTSAGSPAVRPAPGAATARRGAREARRAGGRGAAPSVPAGAAAGCRAAPTCRREASLPPGSRHEARTVSTGATVAVPDSCCGAVIDAASRHDGAGRRGTRLARSGRAGFRRRDGRQPPHACRAFCSPPLPGARADGRAFIADAVARGAAAVLAPTGTAWPRRRAAAPAASSTPSRAGGWRRSPPRWRARSPPSWSAVTGTNGKTSTVEFLRQIWALAGHQAASLGTLGLTAPGFAPGPGLTTPDPVALAGIAGAPGPRRRAARRHRGIVARAGPVPAGRACSWRPAAFTNLTRDHLDYHGTTGSLSRRPSCACSQPLLPEGAPALASTPTRCRELAALRAIAARRHLDLRTVGEGGAAIRLLRAAPLPGRAGTGDRGRRRCAASVCCRCPDGSRPTTRCWPPPWPRRPGLPRRAGPSAAGSPGVRGRMELAARLPNGAAVYVDYAHTPDALERLLTALRPHTPGRLHVVFGAGGDRDPGKRPLMGAAAARLADVAIVTDDNPRSEDPAAIRAAVLAGCPAGRDDRRRARPRSPRRWPISDPAMCWRWPARGTSRARRSAAVTLPFDDVQTVRRLLGKPRPRPSTRRGGDVTLWNSAGSGRGDGRGDAHRFAASGVSIDTRTLRPGDLFVALGGEARDGHAFVADALLRGAGGSAGGLGARGRRGGCAFAGGG